MAKKRKQRNDNGFAILAAVIGLGILALIASSAILVSDLGADVGNQAFIHSRAEAFADAILMQAALALQDARPEMRPRVDGLPSGILVLGKRVTIAIEDEFGKMDLNAAPPVALSRLFQSTGLSAGMADDLADHVDVFRRNGTPWLETDLPVGHPKGPRLFRLLNELLLVPGITRELFLVIEPALTSASGRVIIDTDVAPYAALLAIGGTSRAKAEQMINDRIAGVSPENFKDTTSAGRVLPGIDQRGWPFRVHSSFIFQDVKFDLDATIRLTGEAAFGYVVMEYHFWQSQ